MRLKYVVILLFTNILNINAQVEKKLTSSSETIKKMKVEIWSDVMCPFCYIGKRKFEKALAQFEHKDTIEIVWKSFQLDPTTVTNPALNSIKYLASKKGWSEKQALEASEYVTNLAKKEGLVFNFNKAVVANSFDAHRLSHLGLKHGVQDQIEEALFLAYFTEGKNTADHSILLEIGTNAGIDKEEILSMLNSTLYADDVKKDQFQAKVNSINGVPYFIFNNKIALSGAQESSTFLNSLRKAYKEWSINSINSKSELKEGAVCTPEGICK